MSTSIEADVNVQRFGFKQGDGGGSRLTFPHGEAKRLEGRSGAVSYGVEDVVFEKLSGRLDKLLWTADQTTIGNAWLRDDNGTFDISVARVEMPDDLMLTRSPTGLELQAPTVSLSDMKLSMRGPFGGAQVATDALAPPPTEELRQDKLHFLDSLSGRINVTIKVVLDLPVIGKRTLDQKLKVPIQEGSLDFRALDKSLDWLEGAFLDIEAKGDKLALQWKVPIIGGGRDLLTWKLDDDATKLAAFGKVPVRSLADFRIPSSSKPKPKAKPGSGILKALSLEGLDLALSLLAPRAMETSGGGVVMFGGDDSPGMVDLKVTGGIKDHGPGQLSGTIGSLDLTMKDVKMGPVTVTADRLHFDSLDQLVVTFDNFTPVKIDVLVRRVTATNLSLSLGS